MSEEVKYERQSSETKKIPERRVVVGDPGDLPNSYSTTPGGTIFSTTPGGTRIIYDRKFLLQLRNSPYSQTPPSKLASIPDIISENITTALSSPPATSTDVKSPGLQNGGSRDSTDEFFPIDMEQAH